MEIGRYLLCATSEDGHEHNRNHVIVADLLAAAQHFDHEVNGAPAWQPRALIDLDAGEDLIERVRIGVTVTAE
jgi:hypothetical protein